MILTHHLDGENQNRHAGDDEQRQESVNRSVNAVLLFVFACQIILTLL